MIAADDGGLYEISQEDLLRAATKLSAEDPGYLMIQKAADEGLENAVVENTGKPQDGTGYFVCKTFSECSYSKSVFINVRQPEPQEDPLDLAPDDEE